MPVTPYTDPNDAPDESRDRQEGPHPRGGGGGGGGGSAPSPTPTSTPTYTPPAVTGPRVTGTRLEGTQGAPSHAPITTPQDRLLDIYEHSQKVQQIQEANGEVPDTQRYAASNLIQDLDSILKEVGKTSLPPEVALALAQSNLYEADKEKAARLLAGEFALPLRMVVPRAKDKKGVFHWVDPITGQEISLAAARRIAPHLEASVIYRQLSSTPGSYTTEEGRRGNFITVPGQSPVDPIWTAAGMAILSEHFGDDLSYRQAMSAAIGMAQTQTDLNLFNENLKNILNNGVGEGQAAIALAHTASLSGVTIHNRTDALRFIGSGDARAIDPKTLESGIEDAEALKEQMETPLQEARIGDPLAVGADTQEEYADLVYQNASESIRKTYDYIYGGQPVRKALQEYNKIAIDILDTIQQEDYDNEHSFVGKWLGRANGVFEEIAKPFRGVAAQMVSRADYIYASTWGAVMWEDYDADKIEDQFNKDIVASEQVFGGQRDFTEWLVKDKGWSAPEAMFMDLAATWYADPFIVGGKLLHLTRSAKYFQFAKMYEKEMGAVRWIKYVDKVVDRPMVRLGFKSPAKHLYDNVTQALVKAESKVPTKTIGPNGVVRNTFESVDDMVHATLSGDVPLWAWDKGRFSDIYQQAKRAVDDAGGVDNLPLGDANRRIWEHLHDVELPRSASVDDLYGQHLQKADNIVGYFQDKVRASYQQRWTGQSLDPYFLNYVFDYVRANRGVRTEAELIQDISDMWKVGLGAKPVEGTAAYDFLKGFHDDIARRGQTQISAHEAGQGDWLTAQRMGMEDMEDDLFSKYLDGYGSAHTGNMMHYAPRATLRGAFRRLGRATPGQDTRVARGFRAAFNRSGGNVVDLERNLAVQTDRMLTRSREFSRAEIRAWSLEAQRIMEPRNPNRVTEFQDFVERMQKEIIWREARNLGIDKRLAEDIIEMHLNKAREATDNLFGAGADEMFDATGAQVETQLRNRLVMIDPVSVRRTLHEMVSYRKSVMQWGRRFAPGLDPKEYDVHALIGNARYAKEGGKLIFDDVNDVGKVIDTWQRARDAFLRVWKPAVVVTPRYILRVPLGDETLRYFSDLSVWSRFQNSALGQRLGLAHEEAFEFTLDVTRTNEVVRHVESAGFESVDEAIEVITRSKNPKLPVDPRVHDLPPTTRDLLDGAVAQGNQGVFGTMAVDANGKPLTLYHGSGLRITAADKQFGSNISSKESVWKGNAFYFSTDVDDARHLRRGSGSAQVSEVQLHVTRPLDYDRALTGNFRKQLKSYVEANPQLFRRPKQVVKLLDETEIDTLRNLELRELLKSGVEETKIFEDLGFDALKIRDGNKETWAVFDPGNVVNGLPEKQLQINVKLDIPPAYALPNDVTAVGGIHASEIYETLSQMSRRQAKEAKMKWVRYNVHDMGEEKYAAAWSHILSNQYGRSGLARRVLKAIERKAPVEDSIDDVLEWLRFHPDGKVVHKQLFDGINTANVDKAIEIRVRRIYQDALADPNIARMALNHEATPGWLVGYMTGATGGKGGMLRRTSRDWYDQAPVLHALDAEKATGMKYHAEVIFDNVARSILELPTNHLVRHPFFRDWYNRARKQMLELAKANGTEITEDVTRSINAEARQFAQARVKDVMFDFKEQSRIAEMAQFVAPFMQPFMEAYMVWGRLLADKPQLIGYANHIWREVQKDENGIVRTDPFSGEKYVNLGWLGPAKVLNSFFPGPSDMPGWSVTGNIANLNMFVSSTMELDTHEWTGGLLPDFSIPMPGWSPPFHYVIEKFVQSDLMPPSMKWKAFDYAMQYGSTDWTSTLPMWLRNAAVSTGVIPHDDVVDSYAIDIIKMDYLAGITPQSIAKAEGISVDRAKVLLVAGAKERARDLFGWRAFFSLFLPTSPRIDMPTKELENEYLGYLQGNTTEEALAILKKNNPDLRNLEAFTAASTYWAGTREGAAYFESGGVALPANRAVDMMLENPEFKKWAKENPQTAFMFIPDEFWDLGFDRESYFRQVDEGWRKVKDPLEFINDIDIQEGFSQYRALTDSWANSQEWMQAKGINPDNPTWGTGVGSHIGMDYYLTELSRIKNQHPAFARYGAIREGLGVDIQHDIKWKEVLQNPAYKGTDLGQAISQWIKGRDRILEDMREENVYGTDAPGFYELGFDKRIENLQNEVMTAHPGFKRAFYIFFDEEFNRVADTAWQDQAREIIAEGEAGNVFRWQRQFNKALEKADTAMDDADAIPYYLEARKLSVRASYMAYNPQEAWWNNQLQPEKDAIKLSTRFRPMAFLSQFDRGTILGLNTDEAAEDAWLSVGMWDARLAKFGDDFPWESRKEMYANRDAAVKTLMASSSTFRKQVQIANEWGGLFFFENDLLDGTQPSSKAWKAFRTSLGNMQRQADAKDMVGDNDFDSQRGALYSSMRNTMEDYVKNTLFEYSPAFKRQWYQAQEQYGGRLMEYFMPEWYFPLGGHDTR